MPRSHLSMLLLAVMCCPPAAHAADALVVKASPHSVGKTLDRLSAILAERGLTVFARVDHAAGATKAGLELRPTELLIFGNPKTGTPLMQADQRSGLDLPMKVLAWQDAAGKVWLGYTPIDTVAGRYEVAGRGEVLTAIGTALDKLTSAAVEPK